MFVMVLGYREADRFTFTDGWVQNAVMLGFEEAAMLMSASDEGVDFPESERTEIKADERVFAS